MTNWKGKLLRQVITTMIWCFQSFTHFLHSIWNTKHNPLSGHKGQKVGKSEKTSTQGDLSREPSELHSDTDWDEDTMVCSFVSFLATWIVADLFYLVLRPCSADEAVQQRSWHSVWGKCPQHHASLVAVHASWSVSNFACQLIVH